MSEIFLKFFDVSSGCEEGMTVGIKHKENKRLQKQKFATP